MRTILIIIALLFAKQVKAQWQIGGNISATGFIHSQGELPFWLYSNTRARVSSDTDFAGHSSIYIDYLQNEDWTFKIQGGVFYDNGYYRNLQMDELFAEINYKNFGLVVGRKQRKELYDGLSASDMNFAWSVNSRPIPGIQFSMNEPFWLLRSKALGFELEWDEFFLEKTRYVSNARLHHKKLAFHYRKQGFKLSLGLDHYAQWAGTSPETGVQPKAVSDYFRVITGRGGGENSVEGERQNALGNHLGVYSAQLSQDFNYLNVQLIYNHFFEDGSGSRFANIPDGKYAINVSNRNPGAWWNAILYEFYYTKNQSKNSGGPQDTDAYFNNFQAYRSGWTYHDRIIGLPFFAFDASIPAVTNDKFLAHHFGIASELKFIDSFPIKMKTKVSMVNYSDSSIEDEQIYFSNTLSSQLKHLNVSLLVGADLNQPKDNSLGMGVQLSKSF